MLGSEYKYQPHVMVSVSNIMNGNKRNQCLIRVMKLDEELSSNEVAGLKISKRKAGRITPIKYSFQNCCNREIFQCTNSLEIFNSL